MVMPYNVPVELVMELIRPAGTFKDMTIKIQLQLMRLILMHIIIIVSEVTKQATCAVYVITPSLLRPVACPNIDTIESISTLN